MASTKKLALGGMLSALVLLFTFLIKVPVPATGGYVHLGDGVIFLAAALLGPYAALIGGVGSALSDLLGGYFIYIAPTFVIKAAMGFLAGKHIRENAPGKNAVLFALCECVMVLGYFLYEGVLFGWGAALSAIGPNVIQGAAGVIMGSLLLLLPLRALRLPA